MRPLYAAGDAKFVEVPCRLTCFSHLPAQGNKKCERPVTGLSHFCCIKFYPRFFRLSCKFAARAWAFWSFSRSAATTRSGARETKLSLASYFSWLSISYRALASSFSMRAFSASRSTSSAMGMKIFASPVTTFTMPEVSSGAWVVTVTAPA